MSIQPPGPMVYSEEWWRVTLSSIGDAVIVTDASGKVAFMNPVAESLTGWTIDEAANKPLEEVFPLINEDSRAVVGNPIEKVLRTGTNADLENHAVLRARNGREFSIDDSAAPIKDKQGKVFGVVLVFRDVTGKKRAQSERAHLAAIIESSEDAIVSKTLDSVITSWNQAAERVFGYTAAEAIGRQVYLIIPSERHAEESEILARLKRGEQIEHYETVRQRKDGTLIDVSLTVSPIRDEQGNIVGASKIARDIAEKKKAEAELKEGHQALETIYRVGQLLSSKLDLLGIVQTLTDAATAVTRAAFGSFFYNVVDERRDSYMLYALSGVPPEHFAQFPMPRATDLFGPTFQGEGVIRIADAKQDPRYGKNSPYFGMGHLPVTSYLAVPVIGHSGEVLGGLFFGHPDPGVFSERDENTVKALVTQAASAMDNAQLYESARKARAEAETANRLKDEFLATVSHELRTPLNAILGWARLLHTGKLDDANRTRAIETIERSAVAQGQIIEDILDVSRIITGKLLLDVSPIEIGQLLVESVESVRLTAEAKGVSVKTALDTKANLVWGDSRRLQQIAWNLLSNAIKFTPNGGRVQVTLSRINSHIEIAVSDNGKGISQEFLPHVFERFRQADSSTKRVHGGLGLGLAIVRHLTELHGGSVSAESGGEGLGATFCVRLPLAVPRQGRSLEERRTPSFVPAVDGQMPVRRELGGVRVLVVDDEVDAYELLRIVLQKSGAEVRVAGSAGDALATLKEWKPDVLLSDIGMPGEDGFELIHKIRSLSHKDGGSIPAAALTAYATSDDRLKVLMAGFQTHIAKPVEPLELTAVVAVLAGKTGTAKDK